jgi:hypothetical protein
VLFRWLDQLGYSKCIHPETVREGQKLENKRTRSAFNIKLSSYHVLKSQAPLLAEVEAVSKTLDKDANDVVDTALINELASGRVDLLITEDKKIHRKAALLGLSDRVFKIDSFLEKVTAENPDLADYKVLSVKKALFGEVNLDESFFDSFKVDYPGFERWFARKADETAYVCDSEKGLTAFLYLKVEGKNESYHDITPPFAPKKRLKIGTFKVVLNGVKIGERFLKIIFDNAIRFGVEEVYVTIFKRTLDQKRLIALLQEYGFERWGDKGEEWVLVRRMTPRLNLVEPRKTFPFYGVGGRAFIVPIYPEYHTSLFPDSILSNESPVDFIEHEPFRNAISKVYISRSYFRDLHPGDTIVFYRTGGYRKGVATTIGVVEGIRTDLADEEAFIQACRKRSVYTDEELHKHWIHNQLNRPFIVNFLYNYSLPRRPNLAEMIDLGIITSVNSVPRGFERLSPDQLKLLLNAANADDRFIINQT